MKNLFKNILVTGGAGFIGSNYLEYAVKRYPNINFINIDLLTYAGSLDNLNEINDYPNYFFYHADILDYKFISKIFKKHYIDGVINFAAESHVDNSIIDPYKFVQTNVNGTFNLLNIAYNFWMKEPFKFYSEYKHAKFHQISTDEVFGSIESGSFNEFSPYLPNSPYSASKASADHIVRSFNKTYGFPTTISISSNNYGKNQNQEKLIPKIIKCLKQNIKIPIYGDGLNSRDWIHVNDHCFAIDTIFMKSNPGENYIVSANNELTNIELVSLILEIIKGNSNTINDNIEFITDRFGHDRRYSADSSKLKLKFKWDVTKDFKVEIASLISRY